MAPYVWELSLLSCSALRFTIEGGRLCPEPTAGGMDNARRRRCRSRPRAWAVPKLGAFTLLSCCGRLLRRPPAAAHATPPPPPAFMIRSLPGVPRRGEFLPQWGFRKAAPTRRFRVDRGLRNDELASSCPPKSTSMSMSSGSSSSSVDGEGEKEETRPPTAPASPPPPPPPPSPVKRKVGRPKGARNKPRKREDYVGTEDGGIYKDVGAAELKLLVELKERLRLEMGGDSGDEGGNGDAKLAGEDDNSIDERMRSTLQKLAAERDASRDDDGIGKGISSSTRKGSTSASNDDDATGVGRSKFPRSSSAQEGEGFDLRSEDDNDHDSTPFDDDDSVDGELPFGAEIRDAEERLRELRSQQLRYQKDQQRIEGEEEIDREAAAMDAAVAALFGPGELPSDLLRAGKERERLKRAASRSDPLQPQQREGAKREGSIGEGGQEEVGEEEDEGIEDQDQEQEEEEEEVQPEEPRMQRIPPVRYRRRRQMEARIGESDAFYTGEDEFEEFVLEDPFGAGEGGEGQEDKLPDAWFVMDRLDELLALEPDASDTRLPFQEENLDDETKRFMQMSEDDQSFNSDLRQVLVVIGKHLIRDQVTVEYASRIRRLVQGLRSGRLQPDLVCFTGGVVRDNKVADASAGYIYFRHLCEEHKVDIDGIGFLVESESTCTKEAMQNVVKEVSRLEREREELRAVEAEGLRGTARPRQKYHFTLISNEYHLSRIIMVHQKSEGVSLLAPLKQLQASWGYDQVAYPYACYNDETKKFQADVYKTLEDLVPLQVNVQAVASREEFFQEENYAALAHVRERLDDFIRQMQSSRASRRRARNVDLEDLERTTKQGGSGASDDGSMALSEAVQWAAGALDKIQEIIEPAATRRNSVSLRAWAMCAALLERAILQAQMAADPDRPLTPAEWGALEDEKPPPKKVDEGKQIAVRARERALAHLKEMEAKEAEEEDFGFPESRKVAAGRYGGGGDGDGGGGGGGSGVGIEERMLDMLTPRRGQGVGEMTLHWAGKDARKNLSLEDDDEPFDPSVPPWYGRLTPIDVPEGGFEGKEGDVRGLGRREEDEEGKGGSSPPPLRPLVAETPPQPEGAAADDQPAESPSKSRPVKKRRRGRPRKKSAAPTE